MDNITRLALELPLSWVRLKYIGNKLVWFVFTIQNFGNSDDSQEFKKTQTLGTNKALNRNGLLAYVSSSDPVSITPSNKSPVTYNLTWNLPLTIDGP